MGDNRNNHPNIQRFLNKPDHPSIPTENLLPNLRPLIETEEAMNRNIPSKKAKNIIPPEAIDAPYQVDGSLSLTVSPIPNSSTKFNSYPALPNSNSVDKVRAPNIPNPEISILPERPKTIPGVLNNNGLVKKPVPSTEPIPSIPFQNQKSNSFPPQASSIPVP